MRRCTHTAVKRGISTILLVAVLIGAMLCLWHLKIHPTMVSTPVSPSSATRDAIVLVPLDGRPPCRQFVIDAGQLTGTDVVTPPGELRDYYSQPGDTEGIRPWLMASLAGKKAAILSIDQLLYGGLLAAREKQAPEDLQDSFSLPPQEGSSCFSQRSCQALTTCRLLSLQCEENALPSVSFCGSSESSRRRYCSLHLIRRRPPLRPRGPAGRSSHLCCSPH